MVGLLSLLLLVVSLRRCSAAAATVCVCVADGGGSIDEAIEYALASIFTGTTAHAVYVDGAYVSEVLRGRVSRSAAQLRPGLG
jgi:hypothetical protein